MGLTANTLIGCFLALLPGPPGLKLHNAYFQLFPVDKLNVWCPGIVPQKDVIFYFYNGSSPHGTIKLRLGDGEGLRISGMDSSLPTTFYFPPFFEGADGRSATFIRKAYMKRGGHNFIVVHSKRLSAGPWYPTAVSNTYFVGRYAAKFIDYLVRKGFPIESFHLIGMSIGAHTAGIAGHYTTTGKVPRITGLDPASLLFADKPPEMRLDRSDAVMVDIVHTDDKIGADAPIGHADFYVNAGISPQPGCEFGKVVSETKNLLFAVFCSHLKAYQLYAESVLLPDAFPGRSCSSWRDLKKGRCQYGELEYMGFGVSPMARGLFSVPVIDYQEQNVKQ